MKSRCQQDCTPVWRRDPILCSFKMLANFSSLHTAPASESQQRESNSSNSFPSLCLSDHSKQDSIFWRIYLFRLNPPGKFRTISLLQCPNFLPHHGSTGSTDWGVDILRGILFCLICPHNSYFSVLILGNLKSISHGNHSLRNSLFLARMTNSRFSCPLAIHSQLPFTNSTSSFL